MTGIHAAQQSIAQVTGPACGLTSQQPKLNITTNALSPEHPASRACFCHPKQNNPSLFFPCHSFGLSSRTPPIRQHAGLYQTAAAIVGASIDAATAVQEDIQRPNWPLHQHHREPEDQLRHQGHFPGLHWQAGNVSRRPALALSSLRQRYRHNLCAKKTRWARFHMLTWLLARPSFHAEQAIAYGKYECHSSRLHTNQTLTTYHPVCRHKGCWRHKPQEGWDDPPRPPRLRHRLRCRQGDWCNCHRNLRPVRITYQAGKKKRIVWRSEVDTVPRITWRGANQTCTHRLKRDIQIAR